MTTAGTIGTFVKDRTSGKVALLSNWHVLHGPGASLGADIVQPGRHDDNRVDDNVIGSLLRSHIGPAGDCAIASVVRRRLTSKIVELEVSVDSIGEPELGDLVIKSGRTTGVTLGRVIRIDVNTSVDYGSGVVVIVGGFEVGTAIEFPAAGGEISMGVTQARLGWLPMAEARPQPPCSGCTSPDPQRVPRLPWRATQTR